MGARASRNAAAATTGARPSGSQNKLSAKYMPFGQGAKMCVGYKLANVEMKVMLACWLQACKMAGALLPHGRKTCTLICT